MVPGDSLVACLQEWMVGEPSAADLVPSCNSSEIGEPSLSLWSATVVQSAKLGVARTVVLLPHKLGHPLGENRLRYTPKGS